MVEEVRNCKIRDRGREEEREKGISRKWFGYCRRRWCIKKFPLQMTSFSCLSAVDMLLKRAF